MKREIKQIPFATGLFAGLLGCLHLIDHGWTPSQLFAVGGGVVGGAGTVGLLGYKKLHDLYKKRTKQDMRYMRILPHANTVTTKENVDYLLKAFWRSHRPVIMRLKRGREWFQILFCCEEGEHEKGDISIYLGIPQDRWSFLSQTIKSVYPTTEIVQGISMSQIPLFNQHSPHGKGKILTWSNQKLGGLPLKEFQNEKISKVLEHLEAGCTLAITFSPTSYKNLKKQIKHTRAYLYKVAGFDPKEHPPNKLDSDVQEELKSIKSRELHAYPFTTTIAVYDKEGRDYVIESVINAINSVVAIRNSLSTTWMQWGKQPIQYAPQFLPLPISPQMVWTGSELGNLIHLPEGRRERQRDHRPHIYDRIPHVIAGQSLLPENEFTAGVKVGEYINPAQQNRSVYIDPEQLRFHGVLLGKTGSGKTATALEMTTHLLDERLRRKTGGFTIIDPKATFVKNMLTRINKRKTEGALTDLDLKYMHYFDVTSPEYSFGINPLERPNNRPPSRAVAEEIINRTLDVFKAAWAAESILFERFGRLILKALLADPDEQHTILALPEFLRDESPLRDRLIQKLRQGGRRSQDIARDLEDEVNKGSFSNQKTDPLINRLSRIKESDTLRRIFGQKKTTITPLEWLNNGHIVLFNTEGLSEDQMTILMGYIIYEYHIQCRKRSNHHQNHYMIIDEAHNVKQLEVLHKKVIPEDREFGLSLILMTQMLHQFPTPFFDAITEVAGTYMSCEVGPENARLLEKITQGRISSETVQGMQKLRTVIDATDSKGSRRSFITKIAPPVVYHKDGSPTYYGVDGERTSKEKAKAFADCIETIGKPLMARDCLSNDQIEQQIDAYIASLVTEETEISPEELVKQAQTPKSTLTKKFASTKKRKTSKNNTKRMVILKRKDDGSGDK